jgi:hypothetical protein
MTDYGHEPEILGYFDLARGHRGAPAWEEYMSYQYLPIQIPEFVPEEWELEAREMRPTADPHLHYRIPANLAFAKPLIDDAIAREHAEHGHWWSHLYVTAKHGFATPGNPLNRPGWHADGFGTSDVNIVWVDRYATEFAVQPFENITEDDQASLKQFDYQIDSARIRTYTDGLAMRLDPFVVHAAPTIPAPGGDRRFFKLSFATTRYNLRGNAHNHAFTYSWPMHDRQAARNVTNGDGIQEEGR